MNPLNRAIPAPFQTSSGTFSRDSLKYLAVVRQFDVENAPRYQPTRNVDGTVSTYCSTFSWDVSRAFAAELPHWWDGRELNANALIEWLSFWGPEYGWAECNESEALVWVNQGHPTFATYKNPTGVHGHIAVVLPGKRDALGDPNLMIAQAGERCFFNEPLTHGFGSLPTQFWFHP